MAMHSSVLAWRIPWTDEPGGLQSMESQRLGQDTVTEHGHTPVNHSKDSTVPDKPHNTSFLKRYKFIYLNWRLITLHYCIGFAIH